MGRPGPTIMVPISISPGMSTPSPKRPPITARPILAPGPVRPCMSSSRSSMSIPDRCSSRYPPAAILQVCSHLRRSGREVGHIVAGLLLNNLAIYRATAGSSWPWRRMYLNARCAQTSGSPGEREGRWSRYTAAQEFLYCSLAEGGGETQRTFRRCFCSRGRGDAEEVEEGISWRSR